MKHLWSEVKRFYKNNNALLILEITFLSLMAASLPSIEAPKNIFLVFFVITSLIRQIKTYQLQSWGFWDWIFLATVISGTLSTVFAGYAPAEEWKGFRPFLTYVFVGWLVSRSHYSKNQISWLFWLTILSTLPPLVWGYWELFWLHTKNTLQLHSVGHVNHSAIYLEIIFGASVGATLCLWSKFKNILKITLILMLGFMVAGLIIGESRGAVGVGFISSIFMILMLAKKTNIKIGSLSLVGLIAILTMILNTSVIQKQRDYEKAGNVLSDRDKIWNVSIEAAKYYPAFGLGISNWHFIKIEDLKKSVEARNEVFEPEKYSIQYGHSHNLFLTILVERGWVGFSIFIFFMNAWIFALIKSYKQTKINHGFGVVWAGALSAWLGTFGIGLVNTTMHHEHGILSWLLLGLFLNYLLNQKSQSHPKKIQN